MTYLTYDLVILAVLALFAWMGYRRGFVLTLCSLLAVFFPVVNLCLTFAIWIQYSIFDTGRATICRQNACFFFAFTL